MDLISERHDEQPNGETFSLSEGLIWSPTAPENVRLSLRSDVGQAVWCDVKWTRGETCTIFTRDVYWCAVFYSPVQPVQSRVEITGTHNIDLLKCNSGHSLLNTCNSYKSHKTNCKHVQRLFFSKNRWLENRLDVLIKKQLRTSLTI